MTSNPKREQALAWKDIRCKNHEKFYDAVKMISQEIIALAELSMEHELKVRPSKSGHLTFKSTQILRGVSTSLGSVSMENNDRDLKIFYFFRKSCLYHSVEVPPRREKSCVDLGSCVLRLIFLGSMEQILTLSFQIA